MASELNWCGSDLVEKTLIEEGWELGGLVEGLIDAVEKLRARDELLNRLDLARPLEDLERALRLARPIFLAARMPLERRKAAAGDFGNVLALLSIAEVQLVAIFARARTAFFYRLLRDVKAEPGALP